MKIQNIELISSSLATLKAANAYTGTKAKQRRDKLIQVILSSALYYVENSDVKHLNNIVHIGQDNALARLVRPLVLAIKFNNYSEESGLFVEHKLSKSQKQKRDDVLENIESILNSWLVGEQKESTRTFNADTRIQSLLNALKEHGMNKDDILAAINTKVESLFPSV